MGRLFLSLINGRRCIVEASRFNHDGGDILVPLRDGIYDEKLGGSRAGMAEVLASADGATTHLDPSMLGSGSLRAKARTGLDPRGSDHLDRGGHQCADRDRLPCVDTS